MPNKEHAMGISNNEPPATPEDPHAAKVAVMHNNNVESGLICMPIVFHTASVMTVMVTAAPFMLMVAPNGMLTE